MGVAAATETQPFKSTVVKRSIKLNGHNTSVSLEEPFWLELKSIAAERNVALHDVISTIDANRQQGSLSSAIRLFVLAQYRPDYRQRPLNEAHEGAPRGRPPAR
jgi:predicted DNA-binding ribbon-helix-helix protein